MQESSAKDPEVERFLLEEIDSIPHLEALLLLRSSHPRAWSVGEMAKALYISESHARAVLQGLQRRKLCAAEVPQPSPDQPANGTLPETQGWRYDCASTNRDDLVQRVEMAYRRELVRITRMIHAKGTPGVRGFAEAFRFKKDRE